MQYGNTSMYAPKEKVFQVGETLYLSCILPEALGFRSQKPYMFIVQNKEQNGNINIITE